MSAMSGFILTLSGWVGSLTSLRRLVRSCAAPPSFWGVAVPGVGTNALPCSLALAAWQTNSLRGGCLSCTFLR